MIAIDIDKFERETSSLGNSNNILFHYEFVTWPDIQFCYCRRLLILRLQLQRYTFGSCFLLSILGRFSWFLGLHEDHKYIYAGHIRDGTLNRRTEEECLWKGKVRRREREGPQNPIRVKEMESETLWRTMENANPGKESSTGGKGNVWETGLSVKNSNAHKFGVSNMTMSPSLVVMHGNFCEFSIQNDIWSPHV